METREPKIGDLVHVPPGVSGYGIDIIARITELEYFMDYTMATVSYIQPYSIEGCSGKVCYLDQLTPATENDTPREYDRSELKPDDIVIVPATVSGYGRDVRGRIVDVERYRGYVLVNVIYIDPQLISDRTGKVVHDFQLIPVIRKD